MPLKDEKATAKDVIETECKTADLKEACGSQCDLN